MVFLGHKIEGCQFAGNVREKIVERALKCAKKPSIVFDYDYRLLSILCQPKYPSAPHKMSLSGTTVMFCNMILFEIPASTQTPHTVRCLRRRYISLLSSISRLYDYYRLEIFYKIICSFFIFNYTIHNLGLKVIL